MYIHYICIMKIEDVIKQTNGFKNPIEKAIVNVQYTSSWLNLQNSDVFAPYDISIQQYNILRIIRGQKGKSVTIKFLIDRMLDKSSNASRLVDKLFAKQYVTREQCDSDRRRVDIFITELGLKILQEIDNLNGKNLENSIQLTEKEANQLSNLLDKLRG